MLYHFLFSIGVRAIRASNAAPLVRETVREAIHGAYLETFVDHPGVREIVFKKERNAESSQKCASSL